MKKIGALIQLFVTAGLVMVLSGLVIIRKDDIITLINTYIFPNYSVELGEVNEYYREKNYELVQNTSDFSPKNKQDLINIYYTAINAGKDEFSFYCLKEYESCIDDVQVLANDTNLLSDINNYVHPFNGFARILSSYDNLGKVRIEIVKTYDDNKRKLVEDRVDYLLPLITNEYNSTKDNIKSIHDYIINNVKYDSEKTDNNIEKYDSSTAYGPLFEGYAICGGYTDLMAIFLDKLGIENIKVSSENHIWNAVYLDGNWYHLDLTWDDPVASDGRDYLQYNYFLIDTATLLESEKTEHTFDFNHYLELK